MFIFIGGVLFSSAIKSPEHEVAVFSAIMIIVCWWGQKRFVEHSNGLKQSIEDLKVAENDKKDMYQQTVDWYIKESALKIFFSN